MNSEEVKKSLLWRWCCVGGCENFGIVGLLLSIGVPGLNSCAHYQASEAAIWIWIWSQKSDKSNRRSFEGDGMVRTNDTKCEIPRMSWRSEVEEDQLSMFEERRSDIHPNQCRSKVEQNCCRMALVLRSKLNGMIVLGQLYNVLLSPYRLEIDSPAQCESSTSFFEIVLFVEEETHIQVRAKLSVVHLKVFGS